VGRGVPDGPARRVAGGGVSAPDLQVLVNGARQSLAAGATVEDVLDLLSAPRQGVAVALNGDVLHRREWATALAEGDRVEVLTAVSGG
jgi:sulfur carrier protein